MKNKLIIQTAARSSPLSRIQVDEVLFEIQSYFPAVCFQTNFIKTSGDFDQTTSLRDMDKTDFFTRELDEMLLRGECRITIHSAKDLPEPLPKGISIVAITIGKDPSDSLVFREGESLSSLPCNAVIACSSYRRIETVKKLKSDSTFIDVRGTIEKRLELLEKKKVDGVVIAEAALIRLGLRDLNRISLPGETVPLQGKLAVLAKREDKEMKTLFSCLDSRCKKNMLCTPV